MKYVTKNTNTEFKAYTANDARREVKEALEEGYGFSYIRIFLNDLSRSKDITWEENLQILTELINGTFGDVECSINTY